MIELLSDFLLMLGLMFVVGLAVSLYHGQAGIWWFATVILLPVYAFVDFLKHRKK